MDMHRDTTSCRQVCGIPEHTLSPFVTVPCHSPNRFFPGQGQVAVGSSLVDGDGGTLEETQQRHRGGGGVSQCLQETQETQGLVWALIVP